MSRSEQVGATYRYLLRNGKAFRDRVTLDDHPRSAGGRVEGVAVRNLPAQPNLVEELVEAARRRIEETHGCLVPPHVAATRVLHDYAWPASILVSAPWFLHGLVPVPGADDVMVEPGTGLLAVRPPRSVLAGTGPEQVRRVVAAHHAPLLEALGPHLRRGPRAAWGTVADDLVSGVWWLGRLLEDEEAGIAAATELLPSPLAPYPGGAAFRPIVADDGSRHMTRNRVACCFRYTVEAEACLTCPRTAEAERRARLVGC